MVPKRRVVRGASFQLAGKRQVENLPHGYGRRASQLPVKGYGQRALEVLRVIMPERVTIKRVRIPFAECLRFPGEGKSAQG